MITFIAHMRVKPENSSAYEALMTRVRDLTRQHEPGVAYYEFFKSVEIEDTYLVVEVYRDAQAHASHMATAWVMESIPQSRQLVDGKFDIKQYVCPGSTPTVRRMDDT